MECFPSRRVMDEDRRAGGAAEPDRLIGGLVAGRESGDEPITNDEIAAQVFATARRR